VPRWPAAVLLMGLLSCSGGSDPVVPGPPPPVPPATLDGTWSFRITVVSAEPVPCAYWLGRIYTPTITISQVGTTVFAEGFLDLPQNEMVGTINTGGRVVLSGDYPEEGFITTINQYLDWDGGDALAGTGTWEWTGLNRICERGNLTITATRNP
jgi:hypothetical protein